MEPANFPRPAYPPSQLIAEASFNKHKWHKGDGDMWPLTWAADGLIYAGAGDNCSSPLNVWRAEGFPDNWWGWGGLFLVNNKPLDHTQYCQIPPADPHRGIKPAGMLGLHGRLYMAVEAMNYGEDPAFKRQRNLHGWIITSDDWGVTWNAEATPPDFFTGRVSSCHFINFGKDYDGARDGYVYATFPGADDGKSYWCNGDYLLLGRVAKDRLLERAAWEFCTAVADGQATWSPDEARAQPIFRYPRMTGENHVVYNPGIKRYLMGNFSFTTAQGVPRPYHQDWPTSVGPSQLTLFEAPEPWGPWSVFHVNDDWGTWGDYQPTFCQKWMWDEGRRLTMISSGSYEDYNFTVQELTLKMR